MLVLEGRTSNRIDYSFAKALLGTLATASCCLQRINNLSIWSPGETLGIRKSHQQKREKMCRLLVTVWKRGQRKQKEMLAICWEMSRNENMHKDEQRPVWDSGVQTMHLHLLSIDSCEFKWLQGRGSPIPGVPEIPYADNLPAPEL